MREVVDVQHAIIQAPMAGVQGHVLAAAVSNAGGLGSLPAALLTPDELQRELSALRAATQRPFNVNFFCHATPAPEPAREAAWRAALAPYYRELGVDPAAIRSGTGRMPFDDAVADIVEPFRPAVVSFHFGLPPARLLGRVRGWKSRILSSATTVDEARWLEAHGVDAIIVQGVEAGGHRGMFLTRDVASQLPTFSLLPEVLGAVKVPVIAAGGIGTADDVRKALSLGAAAAQVGTAYLLCPEATTNAVHRAALQSNAGRTTTITNVFTGRPGRGIVNRLVREQGPMSALAPEFPLAASAVAPLRAEAEKRGSGDFSPMWTGVSAGYREVPAAELTAELAG